MLNKKSHHISICLLLILILTPTSFSLAQNQNLIELQSSNVSYSKSNSSLIDDYLKEADLPNTHKLLETNKPLVLSLKEAIEMGLSNNLDIELEKKDIQGKELDLKSTKGPYDTTFQLDFQYTVDSFPITSVLVRSTKNPTHVTTSNFFYNGKISHLYPFGGRLQVDFDNRRFETDEAFSTLKLEYRSKVILSFSQPLLRNFRIDDNRRKAKSLKKQLDISDQILRQKLIQLIARIEEAYYELAFAARKEEVLLESVKFASLELKESQINFDAGKIAQVEVASAQAELASRKLEAVAVQLEIAKVENQLKNLILSDPSDLLWKSHIFTSDPLEFKYQPVDLQTALKTALQERPELKEMELQNQLTQVEIEFFKNQQKPELNIFSAFSMQSAIGQPNNNRPPVEFNGNYFEGILTFPEYTSYSFGFTFSFNRKNRAAKENLAKNLVVQKQLTLRKQKMTQTIVSEVTNALSALDTAARQIDVSQAALLDANTQLKVEKIRLQAGMSNNFSLFQYQNRLVLAELKNLRSTADYLITYSNLRRATAENTISNIKN